MRNVLSALLLFWLVTSAQAQVGDRFVDGFDPFTDRISEDLDAGAYLIYDCEKKSYICVLEEFYRECEARRLKSSGSDSHTQTCAPLGLLPTKRACFQRQLFMVTNNVAMPACTKEAWRQRDLFFN